MAKHRFENALLSGWISTDDKMPPKGCAVLVDGPDWPTYMVALYEPGNTAYPWGVYCGHEKNHFSLDAFDCWMNLPQSIVR